MVSTSSWGSEEDAAARYASSESEPSNPRGGRRVGTFAPSVGCGRCGVERGVGAKF